MSLFGNSRELQFGASKLWQTIGKSEEKKGRLAFIGFREESGEGCFELQLMGGEQAFEAVVVSGWLPAVVSALMLGGEGTSFSSKQEMKFLWKKCPPSSK